VLEDDGAFAFFVKSKNGVAAEILHGDAQVAAELAGHEVAVKSFAGERTGDSAVGTDEPVVKTELLGYGKREGVAASGDEDNLDAGGVGAAKRAEIVRGNLKLRIEESAVDIGGD